MGTSDTTEASSLAAYTILSVLLPSISSFPKEAVHYIYLRKDTPPIPTPDTPRSIFISNVPIDASESAFRAFFKQIEGALVERVIFEGQETATNDTEVLVKGQKWGEVEPSRKRKRGAEGTTEQELALPPTWDFKLKKSGSSAVVVFVDKATADSVLKKSKKLQKKGEKVPWTPTEELGINRYKSHFKLMYPSTAELQQNVNAYLAQYTSLEEIRTRKLKQMRSEPDEDGFITVVRGGRSGPARLEEAQAAAERLKEREKKRVGSTFYRFQTREEAKKRERDLRDKFEEDAKRLKEMKQRKGPIRPES